MSNETIKKIIREHQRVLDHMKEEGVATGEFEASIERLSKLLTNKAPVDAGEALVAGRVFKNYKELCSFIGWKVSTGASKQAQFKELSTLCKYHKEGNKIVIDEVYQQQLVKQDGRREKAIYVNPIKAILFYSLKSFKGELYFSVNKFIELLEIFNKQYHNLQLHKDYKEVAEEIGIDVHTLKGFKVGSKREAQRIIDRALRAMKGQRIIDYVQGRIIVTIDNTYRLASADERKKIQRIEEEELKKLNCFNMSMLTYRNLESKFYYRLRERFDKEGLEYINYTFYGYSIVSHDKTISEQIELLEKEANVIELKGLVKDRLLRFAEGNHEREVKKEYASIGFGEPILEFNTMASNNYIPSFKKAIHSFIDK